MSFVFTKIYLDFIYCAKQDERDDSTEQVNSNVHLPLSIPSLRQSRVRQENTSCCWTL